MSETERYMKETLKPTYQERFIHKQAFACFPQYAYFVVRNRTLLVYQDEETYQQCPERPMSFLNLSSLVCTLTDDALRLSNDFTEMNLRHPQPEKLLELLQAIENGRTMVGAVHLYPKRFIYLGSIGSSKTSK